MYFISV